MAASLLGPAVPFGFDSGLPREDEFAQFGDYLEDMIPDDWLIRQALDATYPSDLGSPLDSYSASNWAASPGGQSLRAGNNHAAISSSSLSPATGSLILTPTSSTQPALFDDATFIEYTSSDITGTSPESSFSQTESDDFVDLGRVAGLPSRGGRNMTSNR
ncbi:hypothetical protein LTR53_018068, partial [Teratosphaeriaceae sp. CCFEE 6253]